MPIVPEPTIRKVGSTVFKRRYAVLASVVLNLWRRGSVETGFREDSAVKNNPKFILSFYVGTLLLWGACTTGASCQEQTIKCDKVPAAVHTAFQAAYPKATIRDCAKEVEKGKVAYEISSIENKASRDILYYEDGTLIVVEEDNPVRRSS